LIQSYFLIFSILPFLSGDILWSIILLAIMLSLMLFSMSRGNKFSLLSIFVITGIVSRISYLSIPWPIPLILPVIIYACFNSGRRLIISCWPDKKEFVFPTLFYALTGACCAALGLIVWHHVFKPDLSKFTALIPDFPLTVIIPIGVLFYCLNAVAEEIVFRGILFKELSATGMAFSTVIVFQAISFGFLHWQGIPGGVAGIVLTAVYGLVQGWIRWKSGGLLAPWLSHVFADLVIFTFVLHALR